MIGDAALLILELAALFLGVSFLVHLSQRWLGEERLRRWMGGRPLVTALKGIGVGFATPFCTYSAIPMLIELRRVGVAPAGYVAFIVAAPVLDPVLFGALVIIVGWLPALVYMAVAFFSALALALITERFGDARLLKPFVEATKDRVVMVSTMAGVRMGGMQEKSCDDTGECESTGNNTWQGWQTETRDAARAAIGLFRSIGPVLLAGVSIGVAIELLIPPEVVATLAGGDSPATIIVAAGLGTPLYFNTELFVPIADSLAAVGVGVGAIVALTISGAGANLPEFVILNKLVQPRALGVFIGYVFLVATVGGFVAQAIFV